MDMHHLQCKSPGIKNIYLLYKYLYSYITWQGVNGAKWCILATSICLRGEGIGVSDV